ncbi:hypothetical protein BDW02DRAFT_565421 [Decorospora gaudefroyi]|uniref:Uncharacterized protein n=1 Tax=Decorospora gaudefroyi TaxID=184978 RepID=A0A6A5KM16_9PLEO|nr:hypothetical protein BDW02DRAFT_565421 [Decorospora gaudefroyi]
MTYTDVEESRTPARGTPSGSRTPLPGISSHRRFRSDEPRSSFAFSRMFQFLGGGIFLPDPTTYDPLEILLNTEDKDERDELTVKWRDNQLSELNFVGVVAALLAGVLTSTGSWPNILPNGATTPWSVRTSWYCGIILALFSLLTAADQTVRLHRLSSHRDGLLNIRKLLAKTNGERSHSARTGRRAPSKLQIFTWQMPAMFLTSSTLCMIVGMFLHVWSATTHMSHPTLWDNNMKVAVVFTTVGVTSIVVFFIGQVAIFSSIRH